MKPKTRTVRRSVALPRQLVEEVTSVAPPNLRHNLNRLVVVALREFAAHQKAQAFEQAMAEMAADPSIRAECASIAREFGVADSDGLKQDHD